MWKACPYERDFYGNYGGVRFEKLGRRKIKVLQNYFKQAMSPPQSNYVAPVYQQPTQGSISNPT